LTAARLRRGRRHRQGPEFGAGADSRQIQRSWRTWRLPFVAATPRAGDAGPARTVRRAQDRV